MKRGRPKKAKDKQRETLKYKQNAPQKTRETKAKNTKIPKQELFSYQSFSFWWVSKISLS